MSSGKSEAIVNSLSALHDLEVSVRGSKIDEAQILMSKMYDILHWQIDASHVCFLIWRIKVITHSSLNYFQYSNKFTGTLNELLQVGKTMDTSSMFDLPIEMLAFLEGDISNPELYQYKLYEDTESRATTFAERVQYLQVTTRNVLQSSRINLFFYRR